MSFIKPPANNPRSSSPVARGSLAVLSVFVLAGLTACAPQNEQTRSTREAGGTIPWNRPASWEGGGALGSQMSQMNQGSGANF